MTQDAVVTKLVSRHVAEVEVERGTACGGTCESCEACVFQNRIRAEAVNKVSALPGQKVVIESKTSDVLGAADIDESRIIAEAAIYADHVAVDEETVRLRSHIAQLRQMLESGSPVGRKADFLIQEFNREANTIGSKCQNADIAKVVVDLKSEIEKIREQIQNIE